MIKAFGLCSDLGFRLDFQFSASFCFSPRPLFSGLCSSFLSHLVAKHGRSTVQQAHEKTAPKKKKKKNSRSENKRCKDPEFFISLFRLKYHGSQSRCKMGKRARGSLDRRLTYVERGKDDLRPRCAARLG